MSDVIRDPVGHEIEEVDLKAVAERTNCQQPDRDVSGIACGYPLPCPHHTVTIDLKDGTITIPRYTAMGSGVLRILDEVTDALMEDTDNAG